MVVPREDEALRVKPRFQHVAHRVERGMVGAGDDELRERRFSEGSKRDVGLPRPALGNQGTHTLLELRRERRGGLGVGADSQEEAAQEGLWVLCRTVRPPLDRIRGEAVDDRVAERDSGCRGARSRLSTAPPSGGGRQPAA